MLDFKNFMNAIIKIAGKQFKVAKDSTLYVPFLNVQVGEKVTFTELLLLLDGDQVITDVAGKKVEAEVLAHRKDDKVIAFKMKRRKGFRKKKGHRTLFSNIKILSIA